MKLLLGGLLIGAVADSTALKGYPKLMGVTSAVATGTASQPSPVSSNLRQVDCPAELRPEVRPRVSCYKLSVPRHYSDSKRGTYDLAVMVRRADNPVTGRDPVLWLHGGPGVGVGASPVNTSHPFFPGADVVYLASRGATGSEPQPCRDLDQQVMQAFVGKRTRAERTDLYTAPYLECGRRMAKLGIKPDEFGTHVNTQDIERLRTALGVRRWNVWANSYGSASAYDLLARYPGSVRAAMLSSPVAPRTDTSEDEPLDAATQAVSRLARYCQNDAACTSLAPDLTALLTKARAEAIAKPLVLKPFPAPMQSAELHLDGEVFDYAIISLTGTQTGNANLPLFLKAVESRNTTALSEFARTLLAQGTTNIFGNASFRCVDLKNGRTLELVDEQRVCAAWGVRNVPFRLARNTKVPVLLLTGELDGNTPPSFGIEAQRMLGRNARVLQIPATSHGAYAFSACAREVAHAFYEDPKAPLKADCATSGTIRFNIPGTTR